MIERQTLPLGLPDGSSVEILRVRDTRARRLRLIVNERGVRLTLPRRTSEKMATAFLHEHRDWLLTALARRTRPEPALPLLPGLHTHLPLRGERLPLHWCEGRFAKAQLGEHGITLTRPAAASEARAKAALREFYLAQARADVGRWLPRYLPELPRAPRQVRIRPLRSLWGSLSASGALSLDLSLVLGRPEAFEYVLVHELCHLLQANHSPAFWHEVSRRWPHWPHARDYLRRDGLSLKSALRGLLD